jgi:DNA-binding NarL/FixJ family response regulator
MFLGSGKKTTLPNTRAQLNKRENVAQLRAEGLSGRAIAKELGIPSSNVFRLIAGLEKAARREVNRGCLS